MPEELVEFLPGFLSRLLDLAEMAITSPGLWYAAGVAGFASVSLPFLKQIYVQRGEPLDVQAPSRGPTRSVRSAPPVPEA